MTQKKKEKQELDPTLKKKRKFQLIVPLVIFPFLTGLFFALGGGKGKPEGHDLEAAMQGFNTSIPSPHFDKKEKILDKLGFYQKAALDSARLADKERDDPYQSLKGISSESRGFVGLSGLGRRVDTTSHLVGGSASSFRIGADPNEERVTNKLEELKRIMSQPQPPISNWASRMQDQQPIVSTQSGADISRLEKIVETLKQTGDSTQNDPQMDRINTTLDKILKIQHPELVEQEQSRKPSNSHVVNHLSKAKPDSCIIPTVGPDVQLTGDTIIKEGMTENDGFFAFDSEGGGQSEVENTVRAVICDNQTLVSGATVKLRLMEDAEFNGRLLAKDNLIYGTATLNNERLLINIKSIAVDNSIYPVNCQVFDLDGMAGIFIPGAIGRDVSKESASEGINGMGINGLDASLGAQAADAGIEAAKSLISKKIRLVRVSLTAGYEVLIKEANQSSNK